MQLALVMDIGIFSKKSCNSSALIGPGNALSDTKSTLFNQSFVNVFRKAAKFYEIRWAVVIVRNAGMKFEQIL